MLRMITTTLLLASAAGLWGQSVSPAPIAFGIYRTGGVTGRGKPAPLGKFGSNLSQCC